MDGITEKIKPIRSLLPGVEAELKSRGKEPDIPICLPGLNRKVWGLRRKSLVIIGGRTSQGKTSFLSQIAFEIANKNIPVLYMSLEETREGLIERMFCQKMEIDNYDLLRGKINEDKEIQIKWNTFSKNIISQIPLLITCGIGKAWREINETIQLIDPKPKVVIVDYIQAIATKYNVSREMTNEYIRQFRQGAIEGDYVGILASQINRGAEMNKRNEPHLWQLKETGVLEEHSDLVLLLHWANFYNNNVNVNDFKVIIAKNRYGVTGEYHLTYIPEFYQFKE